MKLRPRGDGASSSKGEDLLESGENSRGREAIDLNIDWTTLEEEGESNAVADIQDVTGIDLEKIEFTGGIAEKSGRKETGGKEKCEPVLMWEVLEQENDRWIEENLQVDLDEINQSEIEMETADPSDDLIVPLLRHQKEWLAWALKQEESTARGGILADEMGMGKTLQVIALVLLKRSISTGIPQPHLPSSSASSSKELPQIKGTLVICPLVAVRHWVREIDRSTSKGSTKVLEYHGPYRVKNHNQFSHYDFVITTYGIVQSEFRKTVVFTKDKSQYGGKLFHRDKQSEQQINEPKFKNLEVQTRKTNDDKEKSILHCVSWERIVLDEAHHIKERRSSTSKAVFALKSRYRWALSGTPLQNHVGDLYSLIRFLQIVPYSYYFCKLCDCRTLVLSVMECPECHHIHLWHFCWWNRYISKPIRDNAKEGVGRGAMILLKHKVLKNLMLRRTKEGRAADFALPSKIVTLRLDSLDASEEDYYTALIDSTRAEVTAYFAEGHRNFSRITNTFARLRQAVDHAYLVEYYLNPRERKDKAVHTRNNVNNDAEENTVVTSQGDGKEQSSKTDIKGFKSSSILNRIPLENFQTSTKIDALREEIRFMVERDSSAKAVVFSHFSSFLDLIHYSLEKSGVHCVQLDGSISIGARDAAIKKFTEEPSCRIFLMSIKAGGVALNLTVASHVFVMDPGWNPAEELQAQERIHRIGQIKPMRIVRFVMKNTIEEWILMLRRKKELVFESTLDGGTSEILSGLTEEDLRYLFVT